MKKYIISYRLDTTDENGVATEGINEYGELDYTGEINDDAINNAISDATDFLVQGYEIIEIDPRDEKMQQEIANDYIDSYEELLRDYIVDSIYDHPQFDSNNGEVYDHLDEIVSKIFKKQIR